VLSLLRRRRTSSAAGAGVPQRERRDVFISYAREDVAFVRRLHERLLEAQKTCYVDFRDIPQWSEDWQRDLYAQIDASNAVAVVVSPDSVASENVAREVGRAVAGHKRLRPLLLREVDAARVAAELARPQWIDFRDPAGFEARFAELLAVLETDVDWVEQHTRLLLAANDWRERAEDRSLFLGRTDLRQAEAWLARQAGHEPAPSDLQLRFVLASRAAATRRQRRTLGSVALALIVTAALAVFALIQRAQALDQRDQARSRELAALATAQLDSNPERSLRLALRAGRTAPTDEAEAALQQAIAQSHVRMTLRTGRASSPILDSAVTPDGRYAVTVHQDRLGRVWDVRTGRNVATLRGHTAPVTSVDISPDGRLAVTASARRSSALRDDSVRIWELPSGRLVGRLRHDADGIGSAAFSPDGGRVLTTTDPDAFDPATVWDVQSGRRVLELGEDGEMSFATWSPDGTKIATIDDAVTVWDARSGKALRRFRPGRDAFPADVAFSPDGRRLAVAGDGVAFIASLATGRTTPLPGSHELFEALTGVRFCPDGSCVLTTAVDDTARLWSLSGRELRVLRGHTADVTAASFSRDGRYVVTASEDSTARVWSTHSGAQLAVLRGHGASIAGAHFLAGTNRVLTTSADGTARSWDPGVTVLDDHEDFVTDARFSPDGAGVATAASDGVRLWTIAGRLRKHPPTDDLSTVEAVAFSPDGNRLLTEQDTVSLWSGSGARVHSFDPGIGYPAFSPDSSLVAAGATDAVVLFSATSGRRVATLAVGAPDDRKTAVFRPAFSPDGRLVAAPGALTGAHVWDVRRRGRSVDLRTPERIDKVAFSPDGRQLLTAGDSAALLRIWDLDTRKSVVLDRYRSGARSVEYSPDGRLIAAVAAGERSVRVYDAQRQRRVSVLRHENEALGATFDPGSRLLLTVSDEQTAHLWDARSGRLVSTIGGDADTIAAARFDPDGHRIVTASQDGTAIIHRCDECLPYDKLLALARRRAQE
jgi:WD40 repeat protein